LLRDLEILGEIEIGIEEARSEEGVPRDHAERTRLRAHPGATSAAIRIQLGRGRRSIDAPGPAGSRSGDRIPSRRAGIGHGRIAHQGRATGSSVIIPAAIGISRGKWYARLPLPDAR